MDEHDYQFKKKHIERFLAEGDKVKATIFFRGREMAHPEIGRRILERLIEELAEVADRRNRCRGMEGNQMHTILTQQAGQAASRRRRSRRPAPTPRAAEALAAVEREENSDAELKTHRGAAKRFKKTGTGKFLRSRAFKRHILASKTTKRKRDLRGHGVVSDGDAPKLERMLPYK